MNLERFGKISVENTSHFSFWTNNGSELSKEWLIKNISFSSIENSLGNRIRQALSHLRPFNQHQFYDLGYIANFENSLITSMIHVHVDYSFENLNVDNQRNQFVYVSNRNSLSTISNNSFCIGHQRQLPESVTSENNFNLISEQYSLGALRHSTHIVEPILRGSDTLVFDLAALRRSEVRGESRSLPTGLYSEEACQIMRYAGESSNLKYVYIIAEENPIDEDIKSMLIAELIWYLLEGLIYKNIENVKEHPKSFDTYLVDVDGSDIVLTFYKHKISNKWWVNSINNPENYIPCSHEEYNSAIKGNINNNLLNLL